MPTTTNTSVMLTLTHDEAKLIIGALELTAEDARHLAEQVSTGPENESLLIESAVVLENLASYVNNELISAGGAM